MVWAPCCRAPTPGLLPPLLPLPPPVRPPFSLCISLLSCFKPCIHLNLSIPQPGVPPALPGPPHRNFRRPGRRAAPPLAGVLRPQHPVCAAARPAAQHHVRASGAAGGMGVGRQHGQSHQLHAMRACEAGGGWEAAHMGRRHALDVTAAGRLGQGPAEQRRTLCLTPASVAYASTMPLGRHSPQPARLAGGHLLVSRAAGAVLHQQPAARGGLV